MDPRQLVASLVSALFTSLIFVSAATSLPIAHRLASPEQETRPMNGPLPSQSRAGQGSWALPVSFADWTIDVLAVRHNHYTLITGPVMILLYV